MRSAILVLLVLATGCAESAQQAPDKPRASSTPGDNCGGEVCVPPAKCIHYSGMVEGQTSLGCYIACADGKACPKGMTCTMMHDGPGEICQPSR